jgi:hypothetical protein
MCAAALVSACPAMGAVVKATYEFGNTFAADEVGAPAIVPVDPLGLSGFGTDTVFGVTRSVYSFAGSASPTTDQAGLTLDTTGLVDPEHYSVDMVFELNDRVNAWRRILDVQNRQSDNGFYVDPSNNLDVYPVSGSTAAWSNGVYHHVVLTVDGTAVVAYLDGTSQFSTTTALMDLDFDPASNPNAVLGFFLDNVVAGGQGEWSSGSIALARLWDGVLTADEASSLAANPFVPEPGALAIASPAVLLLGRRRRA